MTAGSGEAVIDFGEYFKFMINIQDLIIFDAEGICGPEGLDERSLSAKVESLVLDLRHRLPGVSIEHFFDEDSTRFAGVRIAGDMLGITEPIDLDISCFGGMTLINNEELLSQESGVALRDSIAGAGLSYVQGTIIDEPYAGSARGGLGTWRHRFFDFY